MKNYRTVVAAVRTIVEAKPDNRPACFYFNDDDTACCIVGNVFEEELRAAGINYEAIENVVGIRALITTAENAMNGYRKLNVELTPKASFFLAAVQRSQDANNSWASAYAWAVGLTETMREDEIRVAPITAPRLP